MSGLYWLASSERERQQAMELVTALRQKESRDELGLGTVRDALADLLFPGTSTLHTRARYHLFIPWAYQTAVDRGGSRPLVARVRQAEAELIAAIKDEDGDTAGLIGRDAGAAIKRMPSTLYWQGLHVWGVRRAAGPQSAIERLLVRGGRRVIRDDDGEVIDATGTAVWHPGLPSPPAEHPAGADFTMTFEEADFLSERLVSELRTKGSALAQLVEVDADHLDPAFVWDHPNLDRLSSHNRRIVDQSRRFSELMHGAALLYNVILAHMVESSETEDEHREMFERWADLARAAGDDLAAWNLHELWETTGERVPVRTRRFVASWQELVRDHDPSSLVDHAGARSLIVQRERAMKGRNARTANRKALDQWGGASGTLQLDLRWTTARRLLSDIRQGLKESRAAH